MRKFSRLHLPPPQFNSWYCRGWKNITYIEWMDDQVTQFIFTPNLVTQWAAGVGDKDMDVDDDKAN